VDGGEVAAWEYIAIEEIVEDFGGCVDLLLSVLLLKSIAMLVRSGEDKDEYIPN
jgi:hypothetical protein